MFGPSNFARSPWGPQPQPGSNHNPITPSHTCAWILRGCIWKKMWLESSNSPHDMHSPFEGTCLFQILSLDGSLPLIICHIKFLIVVGILECHTSFKWIVAHPSHILPYIDLVEKPPEASNFHVTTSLSLWGWASQSSRRGYPSRWPRWVPKVLQNLNSQRDPTRASEILISRSSHMAKILGNLSQSRSLPVHVSVHKRIHLPLLTWNFTPTLKMCFIFSILFQTWDLLVIMVARRYFTRMRSAQSPCSFCLSFRTHLVRRAT
jgi:hypothetical protein